MTKPLHKANNPYRDRFLSLLAGLIGGVAAGLGTSFIINMQWNRRTALQNPNGPKDREVKSTRQRSTPLPDSQRLRSSRRKSQAPGSNLATKAIRSKDLQAREEPGMNDSLGG